MKGSRNDAAIRAYSLGIGGAMWTWTGILGIMGRLTEPMTGFIFAVFGVGILFLVLGAVEAITNKGGEDG